MLPASGDMRNVEPGRDTPPHIGRTMSENPPFSYAEHRVENDLKNRGVAFDRRARVRVSSDAHRQARPSLPAASRRILFRGIHYSVFQECSR
jgi:hypothetical protein